MGRPPKHTADEVLARALPVFWQRGFEGTSISDLEAATGQGRQSLYNAFGDKAGLFRAVLELYRTKTNELLEALRRDGARLNAIAAFFAEARAAQRQAGCTSCLAARVAADLPADPTLRGVALATSQAVRDAITTIVVSARARGEIKDRRAPSVLAEFLWSVGNGAAALAVTDGGEAAAARTVRTALDLLAGRR